jgi:ABC-type uncharacterized transport system involved in gliding motility auxiliary subunit
MKTSWIQARQTRYTAYAAGYIVIVVAALGIGNYLAKDNNKSFDATSNKRYSLSDQSIKIVKGLKQDVTLTYYDNTRQFTAPGGAKDLLDRYDNLSSKLHINYVDPEKKPQLARAAGIRTLGTLTMTAGAKREEAKSVTEEEITSGLIRLLKEGERTVCFVTGAGERATDDTGRTGFSAAKEALEKSNYKTKTITLFDAKPAVPQDCTAVIVAGPRKEYLEVAVTALKTYLENGGRALFLLDPPLKFGKEEVSRNEGLVKLLDGWGAKVNSDLALDTSSIGQLFGFNELVPVVTAYESHVSVRDLKGIMSAFPITSSVEVKGSAEKLFSTSPNSYATSNLASPEIRIDPNKDKKGPFALAAAGTVRGAKEGRFAVVGSSDWASNSLLNARQIANRDIFVNLVNWMTSDEDLISIRPKDPEDRRITMNRRQMGSVFFGSVIGLPLIVIFSGLMVWWKRR